MRYSILIYLILLYLPHFNAEQGNTMRKIVFAALASCFLAACATTGKPIDTTKLSQLKPGISTIADAERLFGPPQSTTHNADGTTMLGYGSSSEQMDAKSFIPIAGAFLGRGPHTQTHSLGLIFDAQGHYLKNWEQSTSN